MKGKKEKRQEKIESGKTSIENVDFIVNMMILLSTIWVSTWIMAIKSLMSVMAKKNSISSEFSLW